MSDTEDLMGRALERATKRLTEQAAEIERLRDDLGFQTARAAGHEAVDAYQRSKSAARPRIVCLCGSTKFRGAFERANFSETMAGAIVLSVGCFMHADSVPITGEQKTALDKLHKRKIDLADEVLVLNVGGYIGESTLSEIDYAKAHNKPLRWLEGAEVERLRDDSPDPKLGAFATYVAGAGEGMARQPAAEVVRLKRPHCARCGAAATVGRCDDCEEEIEKALRAQQPAEVALPDELLRWSLDSVLRHLADATEHLLSDHDCDSHGHELRRYAEQAARKWIEWLATPAVIVAATSGDVEVLREWQGGYRADQTHTGAALSSATIVSRDELRPLLAFVRHGAGWGNVRAWQVWDDAPDAVKELAE